MSHGDWPREWGCRIGREVRRHRKAAGLSAQQLSDRTRDLGHMVARSSIANLENGQRPGIAVTEVAVLAHALGVPPVLLLFGLDDGTTHVDVLPSVQALPIAGVDWFAGRARLAADGTAALLVANDDPTGLSHARLEQQDQNQAEHALRRLPDARQRLADVEIEVGDRPGDDEAAFRVEDHRRNVDRLELQLKRAFMELERHRLGLREAGLTPPPIRESIRHAYLAADYIDADERD